MLRRDEKKLAFQGFSPAGDPLRLLKMTGLNHLDEATLLGALLVIKAQLANPEGMELAHNKGREALRVLQERKAQRDREHIEGS